jgi:NADPH2:quinone reductase
MADPLVGDDSTATDVTSGRRRVLFSRLGGPEVLEMVPLHLPPLQHDHVRVKIHAIGLNRFEALFRRDQYVISPSLPSPMGVEAVGTITEIGQGVDDYAVGDRVAILPIQSPAVGTGTYATHADVPAAALVHVADGRSNEEEAATWMASLQAYTLATKVAIGSGDVVIVTAATSSVGTALIQIAHDFGATVIATTRTLARKPELLSLGADHAIATDDEDFVEVVTSITDGRGAKVVYDTVGGPLLPARRIDGTVRPCAGIRCPNLARHPRGPRGRVAGRPRPQVVVLCGPVRTGRVSRSPRRRQGLHRRRPHPRRTQHRHRPRTRLR